METKVGKWGNSLAVRIPRTLAEESKLTEGTAAEMRVEEGRIVIEAHPRYRLDDLIAGITDENRHTEIDSGSSVGGEAW